MCCPDRCHSMYRHRRIFMRAKLTPTFSPSWSSAFCLNKPAQEQKCIVVAPCASQLLVLPIIATDQRRIWDCNGRRLPSAAGKHHPSVSHTSVIALAVSITMMWRLTAVLSVVILVLRHDMVRAQGGEEAEIQRKKERHDMAAWIKANGGEVRQRSEQTKEHTKMALRLLISRNNANADRRG